MVAAFAIIINEKQSFPCTFIFRNNIIIILWKTLSSGGTESSGDHFAFYPSRDRAIIVKRYYCITHRRETSFASLLERFSFTPKFVHNVRKQHRNVWRVRVPYCKAAFCMLHKFPPNRFGTCFEIGFSVLY